MVRKLETLNKIYNSYISNMTLWHYVIQYNSEPKTWQITWIITNRSKSSKQKSCIIASMMIITSWLILALAPYRHFCQCGWRLLKLWFHRAIWSNLIHPGDLTITPFIFTQDSAERKSSTFKYATSAHFLPIYRLELS